MQESEWTLAGEVSELTEDTPLSIKIKDISVGVYTVNGSLYALEDVCPHADALLSQGFVDGDYVECPLHGALFHIPTGKCKKGPVERDLAVFEVKVEGSKIMVGSPHKRS